jgi:hypothetical protein
MHFECKLHVVKESNNKQLCTLLEHLKQRKMWADGAIIKLPCTNTSSIGTELVADQR